MDIITGYIENIVFSQEENGFTVARLKEGRKKELTCIVGPLFSIQPGETLTCTGEWKHHPQHGVQFEVKSFECKAPSDLIGIQKYLESGLIKGIGAVYAKRIVDKFGLKTLELIDQNPKLLLEVEGIGKKRVTLIESCWGQQRSIRDVMVFLRSHQVSPAYAQKIYKRYGDQSIEKVRSNPFHLAKDIFGIGFATADKIASSLGIAKDSFVRIKAAIEHTLWELSNEGHVCYPKQELIALVATTLSLEPSLVQGSLEELIVSHEVIQKEDKIWVRALFLSEMGIGREIARLRNGSCHIRAIHQENALKWVQEKLHIRLAGEQKRAVSAATEKKVHLITGGPGTGKSTITKAILRITEKLTDKILLAAPTGRAAKRMSEITHKKAFTIHALLEMDFQKGGFKKNRDNPLECDLIIIDEASMIDTQLMHHLLKAIPDHARLILIGDIDQLPSVGPGSVLRDLIDSNCLEVTRLKQIFRQAAGSLIITNAHSINKGFFPDLNTEEGKDFIYIEQESPEEILKTIVDLAQRKSSLTQKFHPFDEMQVLSPMRRGVIGTENINLVLQEALNPSNNPLMRMGRRLHVGDKVMQIRNNYQKNIYNGDVGTIAHIDTIDQKLVICFDGRNVEYEFYDLEEVVLAYAVSIHKYQGSECPCVIIPIHTSHFKLLYRNLLYTGITRGKKLVIVIGTKKALGIAINNEEIRKRHTGLIQAMHEFNPQLKEELPDGGA